MRNEEERLQELLERLEAGEPLSDFSGEAAPEDAALLQLAAMLREIGATERDSAVVAAQREQVLQTARPPKVIPTVHGDSASLNGSGRRTSSNAGHESPLNSVQRVTTRLETPIGFLQRTTTWLQARPLTVLGGAVVAALILVIVIGSLVRTPANDTIIVVPPPTGGDSASQSDQVAVDEPITGYEARRSDEGPAIDVVAVAPAHESYLPMLNLPLVAGPDEATVSSVVGLVEVQNEAGDWVIVEHSYRLRPGKRVRTGALSHVSLTFYDGSVAHVGAESELSIDELHAGRQGTRRIILTQWRGESEHEVAHVQADDRTYRVDTPNGSGEATGTAFEVRVMPGVQSFFGVLEGSINVTNVNVTVVVIAGQQVVVNPERPPAEPSFRITGEGEVTALGDTWTIGGQAFAVDVNTVIVGDVAIGDYVLVEGRLGDDGTAVADRIVLIGSALDDTFALSGEVSAIGATSWTVAGQAISVDDETVIEPGVAVGDVVRVEGRVLESGELLATQIYLLDESVPFTFTGVVEAIDVEAWIISGVTVEVDEATAVEHGIELGDLVVASGYREDDRWIATSIEPVPQQANSFTFTGVVDSVAPWRVAGITFETRDWTVIDEGIEPGDRVRVTGRILEDGTWVALGVLLVDEDGLTITFVGTVENMDPWIVSGRVLDVDDNTILDPDVDVGDLVLVRAQRLPEGDWLVLLIARLDDDEPFRGCFTVTAHVVNWANGELILDGWPNLDLGADVDLDEVVELSDALSLAEGESIGQVLDDSVVTIYICVGPDDDVVVVNIIIIFIAADEPPLPQPPPPAPPAPSGDDGKVTVCHKPGRNQHTLTVARSALSAHLGHGDYQGSCR